MVVVATALLRNAICQKNPAFPRRTPHVPVPRPTSPILDVFNTFISLILLLAMYQVCYQRSQVAFLRPKIHCKRSASGNLGHKWKHPLPVDT